MWNVPYRSKITKFQSCLLPRKAVCRSTFIVKSINVAKTLDTWTFSTLSQNDSPISWNETVILQEVGNLLWVVLSVTQLYRAEFRLQSSWVKKGKLLVCFCLFSPTCWQAKLSLKLLKSCKTSVSFFKYSVAPPYGHLGKQSHCYYSHFFQSYKMDIHFLTKKPL